jgi:hypothetical protein
MINNVNEYELERLYNEHDPKYFILKKRHLFG